MSSLLRWGILGTGNIAKQFAAGVATSRRCTVVAVGSRQESSAREFASKYNIQMPYASYSEVLDDKNVDAVYISLPNSMHYDWTMEALRAGKHVLCEKPIAANAVQAVEMFNAAQRYGVKLVEGFMYRSHPQTLAAVEQIRGGAIGQLKMVRTSFCYRTSKIAGNIRFDKKLYGGALMDIGCYCINLSRLLAGQEPDEMHAVAQIHLTGVDEAVAGVLKFRNGVIASFTCGMNLQVDNTAYISGTEGYLEIPIPWKPPLKGAGFTIARGTPPKMDSPNAKNAPTPPRQHIAIDADTDLFGLEADDFAAAVLDNTPPRISRADSIGNMRVLDELRQQVGVPIDENSMVSGYTP